MWLRQTGDGGVLAFGSTDEGVSPEEEIGAGSRGRKKDGADGILPSQGERRSAVTQGLPYERLPTYYLPPECNSFTFRSDHERAEQAMAQKPKVSNLLQKVRNRIAEGRYCITRHADLRMKQRNVTLPAALQVFRSWKMGRNADSLDGANR